jgi:UDP-galactopyranose mutase
LPYDHLIVGAGFSGLVLAERLCTQLGRRCLVIDKRPHIGGNAYDHTDPAGVLIHTYGPHYFRTNSPKIREYLTQFTDWHPVDYRILSHTHGRYYNFPINLNTFEQILGRPSTTAEMESWLAAHRIPIPTPANSEEVILSQVGTELYELFFKGYTLKQWRRHPRDLDPSVCGRIPIRTNRDDRYLREDFQALPKHGYTKMFENIVRACGKNLTLRLNTPYRDILPHIQFRHLAFTGPIDEFFDHRLGHLPYRSLRFEPQSLTPEDLKSQISNPKSGSSDFPIPKNHYQPAMQVNYPNDHDFTRIVEIKHATGQQIENTTIVREYPDDFGPGKEPYYPIPAPDTTALYKQYRHLADTPAAALAQLPTQCGCEKISFIGRLATYRYYNMDQVIGMALHEYETLRTAPTQETLPTSP